MCRSTYAIYKKIIMPSYFRGQPTIWPRMKEILLLCHTKKKNTLLFSYRELHGFSAAGHLHTDTHTHKKDGWAKQDLHDRTNNGAIPLKIAGNEQKGMKYLESDEPDLKRLERTHKPSWILAGKPGMRTAGVWILQNAVNHAEKWKRLVYIIM